MTCTKNYIVTGKKGHSTWWKMLVVSYKPSSKLEELTLEILALGRREHLISSELKH